MDKYYKNCETGEITEKHSTAMECIVLGVRLKSGGTAKWS